MLLRDYQGSFSMARRGRDVIYGRGDSRAMAKGQHVVPNNGAWSVKRAGASRASSTHATQAEAIQAATRIAKNQRTDVYVHGRDGRIRERKDPDSPKG